MECNCGAFVPSGMRNCPSCGRTIDPGGKNPSSINPRAYEPRKLHLSRTMPDLVGMSSGSGASGGSEFFHKLDEYVTSKRPSPKSTKSKKSAQRQPVHILVSAPKPPPELTIRHNVVATTASVRSPQDIMVNTIQKSYVVLDELTQRNGRDIISSSERQFQLRLVVVDKGMHRGDFTIAETGAFTLAHPSTSTKRARRWLDIIQKQARQWGMEPVEQRSPTPWYSLKFRVR